MDRVGGARDDPPAIRCTRRIEWIDTDAAGRYHYTTAFRLVEAAETALLQRLGMGEDFARIPRAHIEIHFKRPLRYWDAVVVSLWVARVGKTSVTYEFQLTHQGAVAVAGRLVGVHIDEHGRAAPWSQEQRRSLELAARPEG